MQIDFWDKNSMSEFWGYVKMLLEGVSPGILMTVAAVGVGLLIGVVIKAWKTADKEQDQEDDIEVRHY